MDDHGGKFQNLRIEETAEEFFELHIPFHYQAKIVEEIMFKGKRGFYNDVFNAINECLSNKIETPTPETINKEFIYELMTSDEVIPNIFMLENSEKSVIVKLNYMFQERMTKMKLHWSRFGNTGVNYYSLYYKLIYKLYKNVKNKIELFYFSHPGFFNSTFLKAPYFHQKNVVLELF
jgi:hypothetical protein